MKTNTGLVEYAQKALSENWGYCLGGYGMILTDRILAQKCSQSGGVGEYNTKNKSYLAGFLGKRVSDCYGIIKGYVWSIGALDPIYNANGCIDRNQEGAYGAAKEKGTLATIPEIPGLVLWMKGHAGVYIGGGKFIECMGAPNGMKLGQITNGKVTSGSKFTHWFKDTWLVYGSTKLNPEQAVDKICNVCGLNSPEYWKQKLKSVQYFESFVLGIAEKLPNSDDGRRLLVGLTPEQAIDKICSVCGFNSPQYWKDQIDIIEWFGDFVCIVAAKLT